MWLSKHDDDDDDDEAKKPANFCKEEERESLNQYQLLRLVNCVGVLLQFALVQMLLSLSRAVKYKATGIAMDVPVVKMLLRVCVVCSKDRELGGGWREGVDSQCRTRRERKAHSPSEEGRGNPTR